MVARQKKTVMCPRPLREHLPKLKKRFAMRRFTKTAALISIVALLLSACNNQYGPPPADGKPRNWGKQHYLENQRYQETIDQGQAQ
jgi:hypothetical protein